MKDDPNRDPDERELVQGCLSCDERAYRELVRRHKARIYNLAWRITGNAEDAADVAQETFVRVLRSLETYDPERPLRSWIYRIASNLSLDVIRRRKHRPIAFEDLSGEDGPIVEPPDPGPAPDERLRLERSRERFEALVRELPEHYQAVLFLRYRERMAYEEIAETLQMPLGTVKVRIHRAHEMLRRRLLARGANP